MSLKSLYKVIAFMAILSVFSVSAYSSVSFGKAATNQYYPEDMKRDSKYFFSSLKRALAGCFEIGGPTLTQDGSDLGYKIKCDFVQALSSSHLMFNLNGHSYSAILSESEDSDGGDVNDLVIYDERNVVVAAKHNVLAFNNIVKALIGTHK